MQIFLSTTRNTLCRAQKIIVYDSGSLICNNCDGLMQIDHYNIILYIIICLKFQDYAVIVIVVL